MEELFTMRGQMKKAATIALGVVGLFLDMGQPAWAQDPPAGPRSWVACAADNGGLTLPPGFCATVFADDIGHARHLAVATNGVVYVNTWSGIYYGKEKPRTDGFLVALQDVDGDGKADVAKRFGDAFGPGRTGGTGLELYNGAVFAEDGDRVMRYALPAGGITPTEPPQVVVSGLPLTGDHPMHPFAIDAKGKLYVSMGSATNACQVDNRKAGSPGNQPCTELETRAGIWLYDANKTGQHFSPAERFATGIRNGEGIAIDPAGDAIYVTQHGRDQLAENWPDLYKPAQGANLPAEELLHLKRGGDAGWPACYFDDVQHKLVLAPEYGGDGGKAVGVCAGKQAPTAAFPAHWAPNDMVLYQGKQFPTAYRGGAFIAFHGSWNRAPGPQGGYNVVFQPLAGGKASGNSVVFADGFAGEIKEPGQAAFRPSGLAVGLDGALYISDDSHGRIWRVVYRGGKPAAGLQPAPAPVAHAAAQTPVDQIPVPPGATAEQVAQGGKVFRGETGGGTCGGCHGSNAKGTPMAPNLTSGKWLWGDGSLVAITRSIADGIPKPKAFRSGMPPMGGAELSKADLAAVSAYVWAIGHAAAH